MRCSIFIFLFSIFTSSLWSQDTLTVPEWFGEIEDRFGIRIFYEDDFIPSKARAGFEIGTSAGEALDAILEGTGLKYLNYKDYAYILAPGERIDRSYDQQYYMNRQAEGQVEESESVEIALREIGKPDEYDPNEQLMLKGFITDDALGEVVLGATVFVVETGEGAITNEIGQYELELPLGNFTLVINSVGFMETTIPIRVYSSGELDVTISKEAVQLDEVVVSAEALNQNIKRTEAGLEVLSASEIKRLPAFLGEVDVVKSLLLLPGVSTVGEGSGGFNVRGGTVDQNLIMQDGMYLFNSSHVLGLFSLFNPDMVKAVNLYKGTMPAKYGGRLSSVLDVEIREGNYQKFSGKGGVGFTSSRLTLETPIKKGESSLIIGGRSSYSDWIFQIVNIADIQQSSAFFYDGNLKFTQRIKNKGKWTLSGYISRDRFKFSDEFDFDWRTKGINTNFNYVLSDNISLSIEGVYSNYESRWDEEEASTAFRLNSSIEYIKVRPEAIINLPSDQTLHVGFEANIYNVEPGEIQPTGAESTVIAETIATEKGRDLSLYANDEWQITPQISLSAGLRFTVFQNLGPGTVAQYEPGTPRNESTRIGEQVYGDGEIIKEYNGLEPRGTLNVGINDESSVKLSYARTQQFINQISNTTAVSPVDVWQLSNFYIEPQKAHNYSLGYFRNFDDNNWETSVEVFYRDIDNLIEYKDIADLLVNQNLETELIQGTGRSYGVELSLKKKAGRWNGWLGYTYSRTERKTSSSFLEEAINNNEYFLSNYDKPHDLSLALSYQTSKRTYFSLNFVYSSGRPTTAPVGSLSIDNAFNVPFYSERNAFRIPDYHRLDISYTIEQSHRKNQSWRSSWTFSVYNVYGRKNAFTVFFTQAPFQDPKTNRLAILGSAFPSLTYNFSF